MRGNARAGAGRGEDDVFGDYYRKHRLQDPPGMRRARAGGARAGGRLEEAEGARGWRFLGFVPFSAG